MPKPKGHWFCNHCDDIVFMSYEKPPQIQRQMVLCPDCGHFACEYIPDKLTREQLGEKWFDTMRRRVQESDTPELQLRCERTPSYPTKLL